MHPEDVKAMLRKRHGSVASFETARGLPPKSVSDVFRGRTNKRVTEAVERELANVTSPEEPDASPSDFSDNTPTERAMHRLNAKAR